MGDDEHMARVRSLNERLRATEPGYQQGYKDGCIDTVKRCVVSNEAERAVIEAAKAYVQQREERPLDPEHVRQALYFDLVETVEELEKGEDDG